MKWLEPSRVTSLVLVLLSSTAVVTSADAQSFGRVGAVNQQATGTPPGGATRTLTVGTGIVVKEHVRTSATGSTQIQFPDQSAVNLGANSDLVIDQFVYNPGARSGTMAMTASRGVLRFIGGNVSHTAGATIRTPAGQIGVRGGMVTVVVWVPPNIAKLLPAGVPPSGTLVVAMFGQITLSNTASTVNLKPGYATMVGSANSPIPAPFLLPDPALRQITALLNSKKGQSGGVGVANAVKPGQVPAGYKYTVLSDPTEPPGTDPLGYISIFGTSGKGPSQTGQGGSVSQPPPPLYRGTGP